MSKKRALISGIGNAVIHLYKGDFMKFNFSIFLFATFAAFAISAQEGHPLDGTNPQDPFRKNGQMFTVTIIPGAKKIEVKVIGKEVASASFAQTDLFGTIKVGNREWVISPRKTKGAFIIETPADLPKNSKSELTLKVKQSDKQEDFNFKLEKP